jgi:hypothetical protein
LWWCPAKNLKEGVHEDEAELVVAVKSRERENSSE